MTDTTQAIERICAAVNDGRSPSLDALAALIDAAKAERARAEAAETEVARLREALEAAQESIATFIGVHGYPIDSGAGDVLLLVNAALRNGEPNT